MQELQKKELMEINGGGIAIGVVVVVCIAAAALGYYNGEKNTDLKYDKETD